MHRPPPTLLAVVAGLLLAAATPPWGFWPLAFAGIALLDHVLDGADGIVRLGRAWIAWLALLLPTLFWMKDLTAPGYVIASMTYAGFLATGTILAPKGPGRFLAYPGGIILAEWLRWRWPFGGVPLSNLAIGQVDGILAPMLRLGGALFVVGMTVVVGSALAACWKRHWSVAAMLATSAVVVLLVGVAAPDGEPTGEFLDVALVQGGGPQGTRAATTEDGIVLERHLAASDGISDVDLVLWPEDVVDVATLVGSPEEAQLQDLARDSGATFMAGVIEDEGSDAFRNWAVVYDPAGDEIDRYEKVERVPFGEWVPFRGVLESIAGDALPARDAAIGTTPAVVDTPVGRLGVSISWEIFFGERARDATNHGGQLLVNPTNGASFSGTQVQTQQVASSRMRAIENGRWVTQIAPTGFSAVVDPDGHVLQRTAVSERAVLYDTVELRTGRTIYVRVGDYLAIALALAGLAAAWIVERRGRLRVS
ncbi:apolipoprotein N-acyltransferase [Actinospongicola halichondriae]|uniref:apolipoprotein N-acyltransferase n=1 Tax=Actinospongicola halichondriae TaxID=3236844 RepID=UPI003D445733